MWAAGCSQGGPAPSTAGLLAGTTLFAKAVDTKSGPSVNPETPENSLDWSKPVALKAVSRLEQGCFSPPRARLGAHLWCRLPRALPIAEHPTASHTPAPCSPGAQGGRFSPAPAGRRAAGFLPPEPRGWWGQSRRPARLAERGPRPRHLPTRDEAGHRLRRPWARASENLGLPAWVMTQTDRQTTWTQPFSKGKEACTDSPGIIVFLRSGSFHGAAGSEGRAALW